MKIYKQLKTLEDYWLFDKTITYIDYSSKYKFSKAHCWYELFPILSPILQFTKEYEEWNI